VEKNLEFPELLRLIDERSAAFCTAVASAPSLDAQVPSCPDWTLLDLVQHLGVGRRAWAATVAAGPDATGKAAPREREALLAWMAASTEQLVEELRKAGPDQGSWTWWRTSQSPQNCGAVARHQLYEIAMHTYDAQLTAGAPQPVPVDLALDAVDEFLSTCCATTEAWPHEPAVVDYHATEGRSWRLWLSADGARVAPLPTHDQTPAPDPDAPDASAQGTANELIMALYGRFPVDALTVKGDRRVFDRLVAWDPA
jgi:uncharacterized protein (TIGR03083 family)